MPAERSPVKPRVTRRPFSGPPPATAVLPAGPRAANVRRVESIPPAPPPPSPEAPPLGRTLRKLAIFAAAVAAGLLLLELTDLADLLREVAPAAEALRALGWPARLVFVAAVAAATAVGFPRLALCTVAGAAFGFEEGLLWTTLASVASAYAVFLYLRGGGRPDRWRARLRGRWHRLAALAERPGLGGVILVRLLPVPGLLATAALALTRVSHRSFLLGTTVGLMPEAIPATLLGVGVMDVALARSAKGTLAVVAVTAVAVLVVWALWDRRQRR